MTDVKKIITIIIRLLALAFIIQAIVPMISMIVILIIQHLSSDPLRISNYESFLSISIIHLIIGLILYAKSKSLANYLINSLKEDKELLPQDSSNFEN